MDKNITRDELIQELCAAFQNTPPIQDGDIPIKEASRAMGIHPTTLIHRIENGMVPKDWELVERIGNKGQKTKCLRKMSDD
jgi:hypothetical protein